MSSEESAQSNNLRILAVEDDKSILKLYEALLGKQGYQLEFALSGQEAVQKIQTGHYDLISLDLRLPDMEGIDLLKKIKDKIEWTPVIIITANPTLESSIAAVNAGIVTEYIVKPFESKELILIVDKAVEKARLAIENRRLVKKLAKTNQALAQRVEELENLVQESLQYKTENSQLKKYVVELEGKLKIERGGK